MLSQEQIKAIATKLNVPEQDLGAAITEALPEGAQLVLPADLDRIKTDEYAKGKTAGVEMAVKEARDKHGLTFTGKTVDGLLSAFADKKLQEANIPANEKVATLQKDVETLQATITEQRTQLEQRNAEMNETKNMAALYQSIPSLGENAPAVSTVVALMNTEGYKLDQDNGVLVFKKNGETVKDKLAKPVTVQTVITDYAKDKKLIVEGAAPSGRGAGSSGGGVKPTKLSEIKEQFVAEGKSLNGSEFMSKVRDLQKENPDFLMD